MIPPTAFNKPEPTPEPPPPPAPPGSLSLTRSELVQIASHCDLLKLFGERQVKEITVDYVPARAALVWPRLPGDGPLEACMPHVEEITFHLEDTQIGGEVWACVTCRSMVIVRPWKWDSWASLARCHIA